MISTKTIPLFPKTGHNIIGWAKIDDSDYATLSLHRWVLAPNGSVIRRDGDKVLTLLQQLLGKDVEIYDRDSIHFLDGDAMNFARDNITIM